MTIEEFNARYYPGVSVLHEWRRTKTLHFAFNSIDGVPSVVIDAKSIVYREEWLIVPLSEIRIDEEAEDRKKAAEWRQGMEDLCEQRAREKRGRP
jgi:hypothetical protein